MFFSLLQTVSATEHLPERFLYLVSIKKYPRNIQKTSDFDILYFCNNKKVEIWIYVRYGKRRKMMCGRIDMTGRLDVTGRRRMA